MTAPNNRTGRPRRQPYLAHDARRIAHRMRRAYSELRAIGYLLAQYPEVAAAFNQRAPLAMARYVSATVTYERALQEMYALVEGRQVAEVGPTDA